MNIPDGNPSFRHPLIHWAAVLGKGEVLKVLQQAPLSLDITVRCDDSSTGLHRAMLLWNAKEMSVNEAVSVVEQLRDCVYERNSKLQTPLHLCAMNLAKCVKQDFGLWKEVMNTMVTVTDDGKLTDVLNSQDVNGDTILHTLSANEDLLDLIHSLLCCGANFSIMNCREEKPIDIAWKFSISVYNLYRVITTEIGLHEFYADKNVRRTRSATGLSTMKKDYKKFFDDTSDKSDDDEENYVVSKRKSNSRSTSKMEQCKRVRQIEATTSTSSNKVPTLEWEQKPAGYSERLVKKSRSELMDIDDDEDISDPPSVSDAYPFDQTYSQLRLQERRFEDEIDETMKSIIALFPDEAASK